MSIRKHPLCRIFLERSARGIVLRVVAWYLFLAALLYVIQDDLIFHPATMTTAEWYAQAKTAEVEVLPESLALVAEPTESARGTIVLFHGNGENAMARAWVAKRMAGLGFRTVMAEYPGFGASPGPLGSPHMLADGRKLIAQVRERFPGPLQIWGESMGSGPASVLASEEVAAGRSVAKVVLIVPYDKLSEVAQHDMPVFPVRLLLKHDFDNTAALAHFPGRVDIVVADQDEVVRPEQGRQLRQNLAHLKGHYAEFHGGHTSWAVRMTAELWQSLLDGQGEDQHLGPAQK